MKKQLYPLYSRLTKTINQYKAAWKLRNHASELLMQVHREGDFVRRPGTFYQQDLQHYAASVAGVAGAFTEIGVRHGMTFRKLIPIARSQSKPIYAVDSFEGTKQVDAVLDGREDHDMSIGGAQVFFDLMNKAGFDPASYNTLVGWVPEVFAKYPPDITFSFAIIDVDNFTPTRDALEFVWPRLNPNGILMLDDFCTYHQIDAGYAIRTFLRERSDYWLERVLPNYQLVLRKQPNT